MAAVVEEVYCFDAIVNNNDGDNSDDIRMIFGLYGDGGVAERRRRKATMRRQRTRIEGRRFGGAGQIEIQWTDRRR